MVHDDSCGSFQADATLTAAEKATIAAWVEGGAGRGHAGHADAAVQAGAGGRARRSRRRRSPPSRRAARWRSSTTTAASCWTRRTRRTRSSPATTSFRATRPSSTTSSCSPSIRRRWAPATGPTRRSCRSWTARRPIASGWPCFGAAGDGVDVSGVPVTWAPGQGVVNYPNGMGVPVQHHRQAGGAGALQPRRPVERGQDRQHHRAPALRELGQPRPGVPASRSVPGQPGQRDARLATGRPGEHEVHVDADRAPTSAWAASRTSIWWPSCRTCTSAASARR